MRISDWSSDVCSSDLSFLGPTRKEVSQYPRRCLRLLIEKEMPARHGRGADIRAALAPFRRNVEQGRHDAVLRPQSQQRTCHLGCDVGGVMFEVDRRSRAVIRAGRGDHCGVAPTAAIFRQHLGSERVQRRAPIAAQARTEEHTSELQSLMRSSYAVFCLKKNKPTIHFTYTIQQPDTAEQ